jgi:hypothetical protein
LHEQPFDGVLQDQIALEHQLCGRSVLAGGRFCDTELVPAAQDTDELSAIAQSYHEFLYIARRSVESSRGNLPGASQRTICEIQELRGGREHLWWQLRHRRWPCWHLLLIHRSSRRTLWPRVIVIELIHARIRCIAQEQKKWGLNLKNTLHLCVIILVPKLFMTWGEIWYA